MHHHSSSKPRPSSLLTMMLVAAMTMGGHALAGLNQFQLENATAIARGATYKEPIWVPTGASTIGGQNGSGIDFNGKAIPASGAWGNNAGNTRTNLAGYNTTTAQQATSASTVNFQA